MNQIGTYLKFVVFLYRKIKEAFLNSLKSVAVANRGEIAVRVVKTLKEMGIKSTLLHSSEDQNSLAYRMADESLCIGSGEASESYLNIPAVVYGAKSQGVEALHPGTGFLSESFLLAEALEKEGISFIGPEVEQIKLFGNKIEALKHASSLGLAVLRSDFSRSDDLLFKEAQKMGFPIMIKAASGGGGLGLKKSESPQDFFSDLKSVKGQSLRAFGSSEVYIEKFLPKSRHIEVQVFGDYSEVFHLFERDCSVQKRNQKIIEESPSNLDPNLKKKLFSSALRLAKGLKQAATVEFLVKDEEFYFIEMNTRLQVEHPVTEMLLNVDLVRAQILTVMKKPPFFKPQFSPKGHVLECRIYSKDFNKDYPVFGIFGGMSLPDWPHVRFDMGYGSYDKLPGIYDSLIGKVIVWAETRPQAIEKMKCVLKNSVIFGIPTNKEELLDILSSSEFINNQFYSSFFDSKKEEKKTPLLSEEERAVIQKQAALLLEKRKNSFFNPFVKS